MIEPLKAACGFCYAVPGQACVGLARHGDRQRYHFTRYGAVPPLSGERPVSGGAVPAPAQGEDVTTSKTWRWPGRAFGHDDARATVPGWINDLPVRVLDVEFEREAIDVTEKEDRTGPRRYEAGRELVHAEIQGHDLVRLHDRVAFAVEVRGVRYTATGTVKVFESRAEIGVIPSWCFTLSTTEPSTRVEPTTPGKAEEPAADEPLNDLGHEIREINKANGWRVTTPSEWDGEVHPREVPAILALVHSEVSEALEAFRNRDRANFEEELADVLIRVLDLAIGLGIDMDEAVAAKLAKNRARGFRHGGKVV